ncbi:MAG: putative membrane protein YdjX (TVP38/TMEM64 family) [Halobacteriales archaeon]|jgi:uncharacterized membrane protein YdjX (TVP38/TMEM64 family)
MRDLPRIFASARGRRTTVALLVAVVVLLVAGTVAVGRLLPDLTDPIAVRTAGRSYGPLAPLVSVLPQATPVVVAPIPGQAMGLTQRLPLRRGLRDPL